MRSFTRRALAALVAGVVVATFASGCAATQPTPSPATGADWRDNVSPEVLELDDAFQAAHDALTDSIGPIGQLIAEDPTDCRIEAEQRIADQLVELIDTHQVQLQALLKVEREGGQHDEAALAKATHDLEAMQEEIDGNDDALASCEKEAGQ